MKEFIEIRNARIHNLKHVDVRIPKGKLTVITGVSGSGKSSLAFDTLYEEGKRRYLMFSGTQFMVDEVPNFDEISGLSPTVAVEQRVIRQSNPRSTVGTRTKINNMLAALFATYGEQDENVQNEQTNEMEPLSMEMFLVNSPKGMCPKCLGKGFAYRYDENEVIRDDMRVKDIYQNLFWLHRFFRRQWADLMGRYGFGLEDRVGSLSEEAKEKVMYGDEENGFIGVIPFSEERTRIEGRQDSFECRGVHFERVKCDRCNGSGLGKVAANTRFGGKTITELQDMYIRELRDFLKAMEKEKDSPLLKEIGVKLDCMVDVGLHHLALSRPVPTLFGGEIQRLFLASYIIAEMDSIIFVFDEPTIGLHEVEKQQLIEIVRNLVRRGNTVIAVEHDMNFMRNADYIVDLGPDAGYLGGRKVFEGTYEEFLKCQTSRTSPYLGKEFKEKIKRDYKRPEPEQRLTICGAKLHNLKNLKVDIPLGVMVGIAGVSGSGKSSLISDTLVPKLKEVLRSRCVDDGEDDFMSQKVDVELEGSEHISRCLIIDQKPIGRSRTSCPATYTGVFDKIRDLYAASEYAKERGYTKSLFSVNAKGGCRTCKGDGVIHLYVGFGNFIDQVCEKCKGTGFNSQAMEVKIDGLTIRDVLELTVEEAIPFFKNIPQGQGNVKGILQILTTLKRVGMGYIKLGQKTPTISGGESQRVKLATELAKNTARGICRKKDKMPLYILDEPTTGLSYYDTEKLMKLMQELVDEGNSIIVTEHDPYVLSNCDYLIEMGPGGGSDGGMIIAAGTPEEIRKNPKSVIAPYLMKA
ncbi:MAG: excinuclease ABC subunit UvrA [Lachnospiraceae bacterium]|nr:excinuclease ABC subunit UvrA [Lachnospiraceae bacterium]